MNYSHHIISVAYKSLVCYNRIFNGKQEICFAALKSNEYLLYVTKKNQWKTRSMYCSTRKQYISLICVYVLYRWQCLGQYVPSESQRWAGTWLSLSCIGRAPALMQIFFFIWFLLNQYYSLHCRLTLVPWWPREDAPKKANVI